MDVSVVQPLLQHGVLGIMCVLMLGWIYRMDKRFREDLAAAQEAAKGERDSAEKRQKDLQNELATEQRARVEDAQRFTNLALELQAQAVEACSALKGHLSEYKRIASGVEDLVHLMRDEGGGT
jgi:Mg2+/citrate symporter